MPVVSIWSRAIVCLGQRNRLEISSWTRAEIRRIRISVIDHSIVRECHLDDEKNKLNYKMRNIRQLYFSLKIRQKGLSTP